jgi:hypothetical protein
MSAGPFAVEGEIDDATPVSVGRTEGDASAWGRYPFSATQSTPSWIRIPADPYNASTTDNG